MFKCPCICVTGYSGFFFACLDAMSFFVLQDVIWTVSSYLSFVETRQGTAEYINCFAVHKPNQPVMPNVQLSISLIWNRDANSSMRLPFLNLSLSLSLKGEWMRPKGTTLSLYAVCIVARIWLYLCVNPSSVGQGIWRLAASKLQIRARQTSVQRKTCCYKTDIAQCMCIFVSTVR